MNRATFLQRLGLCTLAGVFARPILARDGEAKVESLGLAREPARLQQCTRSPTIGCPITGADIQWNTVTANRITVTKLSDITC